ncbi:acetylornithine aminotransferase argD domain protein [Mycobacterium intracellulare 1956]|uniref:Acetylornithine aminotransferase argD domain protein n=1 Tax=Mycobacterium intracellulare 1956 TaxID=1299331 RepID=X8CFM2_MYCIT|nr:acetylornithine aminotransferase argD domain protein [Mycobacterium intracellulare 1956]
MLGCPVSASDPIVRPWKASCAATSFVRPVSRDILKATSLASVPELQKNTRAGVSSGAPSRATSSSASAMPGSVAYRLDVWPSVAICRVTASMIAGWRWPRMLTAMPPSRSR